MNVLSARRGRWRLALIFTLLLALVAGACGGDDDGGEGADPTTAPTGGDGGDSTTTAAPDEPVAGGEATILLFSEIGTLDPVRMTGSGGSDGQRGFILYGGLLTVNAETSQADPLLAESFEVDATGTIWTIKLKPDTVMSDGSPYDADAIVANWTRAKDVANRSPAFTTLMNVTTMNVVDPLTLEVTLSAPNPHFDKAVARTSANYIASKVALDAKTDLTSTAIGAGPYILDEWIRDDRMVMSKNPNWKGGEGPYLDKITFRVVGNEDQRIDTFAQGQADAFYTATPASVSRAQDEVEGAEYPSVPITTGQTINFNNAKPPFDDIRVRTAFAQGVDWAAMAENVFGEGAVAPYNMTLEGTPWYNPDATLPPYDPDAAKALIDEYLADTGGGDKLVLDYMAFQQTLDQARATFIQASLQELGNVTVNVTVGDSATNINKVVVERSFMVGSWGFPVNDPDPGLYASSHSTSLNNYSNYKNPEFDALMDEARLIADDDAARKELYDQAWEILAKDIPYYPYVATINGFVVSPDFGGGSVIYDGILRFDLLYKKA